MKKLSYRGSKFLAGTTKIVTNSLIYIRVIQHCLKLKFCIGLAPGVNPIKLHLNRPIPQYRTKHSGTLLKNILKHLCTFVVPGKIF